MKKRCKTCINYIHDEYSSHEKFGDCLELYKILFIDDEKNEDNTKLYISSTDGVSINIGEDFNCIHYKPIYTCECCNYIIKDFTEYICGLKWKERKNLKICKSFKLKEELKGE